MSAAAYDVAIVGGGPVGAALALALARDAARVALIEGRAPSATSSEWDTRVYAISPGSRTFLAGLGAWAALAAERVCAIAGMQVWGDAGDATIGFDAAEAGRQDLGAIVEVGRLQEALWRLLPGEPGITLHCPAQCVSLQLDAGNPRITLADGETIEAALVVGADGPDSWLRSAAQLSANIKPYAQTAVVANFATARPHGDIARQWFRGDGVLAWLPLPGERISIVWSAETAVAAELLALDESQLCVRVAAAGQHLLGPLAVITPPASFALRLIEVPKTVRPGVALVGDAAHVVHPLAGQGVNLGFRDARVLADVLRNRGRHEAAGDLSVLRRYERARREDWLVTQWVTDGLHALFDPRRRHLARLRNLGLAAANRLPALRRSLIRHAVQ